MSGQFLGTPLFDSMFRNDGDVNQRTIRNQAAGYIFEYESMVMCCR
jgi:hypothetical protein